MHIIALIKITFTKNKKNGEETHLQKHNLQKQLKNCKSALTVTKNEKQKHLNEGSMLSQRADSKDGIPIRESKRLVQVKC